jgi:hypothetical protein
VGIVGLSVSVGREAVVGKGVLPSRADHFRPGVTFWRRTSILCEVMRQELFEGSIGAKRGSTENSNVEWEASMGKVISSWTSRY